MAATLPLSLDTGMKAVLSTLFQEQEICLLYFLLLYSPLDTALLFGVNATIG